MPTPHRPARAADRSSRSAIDCAASPVGDPRRGKRARFSGVYDIASDTDRHRLPRRSRRPVGDSAQQRHAAANTHQSTAGGRASAGRHRIRIVSANVHASEKAHRRGQHDSDDPRRRLTTTASPRAECAWSFGKEVLLA